MGEELGLLGTLGAVTLYALLVARAGRIALTASTPFRQLLAFGLAALLGLQALTIMAGSLKLVPLTGVTLPFVSYGGSSLVTSFAIVGLLFAAEQPS
jgi:cell division protein FtsW (lipid II flippase)